jgi:hypothetical protein
LSFCSLSLSAFSFHFSLFSYVLSLHFPSVLFSSSYFPYFRFLLFYLFSLILPSHSFFLLLSIFSFVSSLSVLQLFFIVVLLLLCLFALRFCYISSCFLSSCLGVQERTSRPCQAQGPPGRHPALSRPGAVFTVAPGTIITHAALADFTPACFAARTFRFIFAALERSGAQPNKRDRERRAHIPYVTAREGTRKHEKAREFAFGKPTLADPLHSLPLYSKCSINLSAFNTSESRTDLRCERSEVFTAVTMKNVVFWDIKLQFVLHRDTLRLHHRFQPCNAIKI